MTGECQWYCPICQKNVGSDKSFCTECGMDRETALSYRKEERVASEEVFRCPICDASVERVAEFCKKCKEDMDLADGEYNSCPACGSKMPIDAKVCSECGLGASVVLSSSKCANCGVEVETGETYCSKCSQEASGQVNETIMRQFRSYQEEITKMMGKAREMDLPVSVFERDLSGAQLMMEAGDAEGAIMLVTKCEDALKSQVMQCEILNSTLNKSRYKIEHAEKDGYDVSQAREFLNQAIYCRKKRDFKKGISLAMKAGDEVEKSQTNVKAWQVEVGGYLK